MKIRQLIRSLVLAGDAIYILWVVYNGIDEGFKDILSVQAAALIGLVVLLAFNMIILSQRP